MNAENRTIYLFGEINEQSVLPIISQIIGVNEEDDIKENMINGYEREPIKLFINSGGGSVHDGFSLADVILNSKTPIATYCLGKCFSMGFVLFICGHVRIMAENSLCMYHQISCGAEDCLESVESSIDLTKKLQERIHNIIAKRTKIKIPQLEKCNKGKENWFMNKEECIKLEVADHIYEGR